MSRNLSILVSALGLLACGQIANGQQGEVVSYHGIFDTPQTIPVPAGGFVLTDIIILDGQGAITIITLNEKLMAVTTPKARFRATEGQQMSYHLQSGIVFAGGSEISFDGSFNIPANVTISGYIPTAASSGTVPAISTWGIAIMLMLIVATGTLVFRGKTTHIQ